MAAYGARIRWRCDGDFAAGNYSRAHRILFDGGADVPASASPHIVKPPLSDPAGVDPEEMLVASAASCHMLWFLDLARGAGFEVREYSDDATGTLGRDDRGRVAMTKIILSPQIAFEGPAPSAAQLADLHHQAHERCFIANTLRCDVEVLSAG